jgi:hypothetical protein
MGLIRRTIIGGGDATVTITSINNALSQGSDIQIEQTKTYLNISGFDASCYDLVAIREMPLNINNKILDAGLDNL